MPARDELQQQRVMKQSQLSLSETPAAGARHLCDHGVEGPSLRMQPGALQMAVAGLKGRFLEDAKIQPGAEDG